MKTKIVVLIIGLLALISLSACTDKNAREREIKQQIINRANENLQKIEDAEKQQDKVQDLLKQLS